MPTCQSEVPKNVVGVGRSQPFGDVDIFESRAYTQHDVNLFEGIESASVVELRVGRRKLVAV